MSIAFIDLKTQYRAIEASVQARMQKVFEHGQFILGPEVTECETALAKFTGCNHALSCSSGSDALLLAMMALEIQPADEVIVPGFSFIATAEMIALMGAKPVFVDIRPDTFNIDASLIEAAITDKTKAIVTVGLYGQPADMKEISEIADRHQLTVIEDAAQSFGAEYQGKKSGALSRIGGTSFFPAKPLGCYGDGGAVFTNDTSLHEKMVSLRMHGQAPKERYQHLRIGINGRMDTLQCAVILAKLERFPWEIEQRALVAARYNQAFASMDEVTTPVVLGDRSSVYAQYTLRTQKRDELRAFLGEKGIPTAVHYPLPMYRQPAYEKYHSSAALDECDRASQEVVSLPMHPDLDENTQELITSAIKEFFNHSN